MFLQILIVIVSFTAGVLSSDLATVPTKYDATKFSKTDMWQDNIKALSHSTTKQYGPDESKTFHEEKSTVTEAGVFTEPTKTISLTTPVTDGEKPTTESPSAYPGEISTITLDNSTTTIAPSTSKLKPDMGGDVTISTTVTVTDPADKTSPLTSPVSALETLSSTLRQELDWDLEKTTPSKVTDIIDSKTSTSKSPVKTCDLQVKLRAEDSKTLIVEWNACVGASYYNVEVEGSEIHVDGQRTSYQINDLTPGHQYVVRVRECDEREGCGEYTSASSYTYPAVPLDIQLREANFSSLRITWIQEGSILYYVVLVDGATVTESQIIQTESNNRINVSCIITDLETPGKEYPVSIQACVESLCTVPISVVYQTAPVPPASLEVQSRTVDSLMICWTQEGWTSNFSVTVDGHQATFTLELCQHNSEDATHSQGARVTGLSVPGHVYNISISAHSGRLISDFSSIAASTSPSAPGDISLYNRTHNSMILVWNQVGEFDSLEVSVDKLSIESPQFSFVRSTSYSLVQLVLNTLAPAGALHNISVAAISHQHRGQATVVSFRTVPEVPSILCLTRSNISIVICPVNQTPLSNLKYKYAVTLVNPSGFSSFISGFAFPGDLVNNLCKSTTPGGTATSLSGWVVNGLIPGGTYSISVQGVIGEARSDSSAINCTTYTSAPSSISINDTNETTLKVIWRKPQGYFDSFKVTCASGKSNSTHTLNKTPTHIDGVAPILSTNEKVSPVIPENQSLFVEFGDYCSNLAAGTLHTITVSTMLSSASQAHTSPAISQQYVTTPFPARISIAYRWSTTVALSLSYPTERADCTHYMIQISGISDRKKINCTDSLYTAVSLLDNTEYRFTATVQSSYREISSKESKPVSVTAWTLPGSVIDLSVTSVGFDGLNITWIQPGRRGSILGYKLTVSNTSGCCDLILILSCVEKMAEACSGCWQVTSYQRIDCRPHSLSFVVSSLEASSNYSVAVEAINPGGYGDKMLVYQVTAAISHGYLTAVYGGLAGFAVFLVITCMSVFLIFFIRKRKPKQAMPASNMPSCEVLGFPNPTFSVEMDDLVIRPKPVAIKDFPSHVAKLHKDSDFKFSAEFAFLGSSSRRNSQIASQLAVNRVKNRYVNILPFDVSRVKLITIDEDEEGSDYINASYVPGFSSKREFIATQGPMKNTTVDFWRMVWEQNVHMIVMLTNIVERNKEKCCRYWPYVNEPVKYGSMEIQLISEKPRDDYTLRIMSIKHGDKTRTVRQMQFHTWADFGCPDSTSVLLSFVWKVRRQMSRQSVQNPCGPVLVHCSAGVGRTGTYILMDRMLQVMTTRSSLDVFGLVLEMRGYRPNMVQTEAQYIFAHECLLTAIEKQLYIPGKQSDYISEDEEDLQSIYSMDVIAR